jgi:[histone H3]-lysine9 N-trimethyltransferase SUV39H
VQKPNPKPSAAQASKAGPSYQFVSSAPSQFELVVPLSQDAFVSSKPKQGPIPYIVDEAKERKALLAELKVSTEPIKTRLADVEKYFGQTGFSVAFSTEVDELRLRNAASKKQRKVRRKSIKLDWGEAPPAAPREDNASTDLVHPTQQVKQLLTARFQEDHSPPLTFANDINDRRLNGKFQFVDRYVYRAGVRTADPAFNYGCKCTGSCNPIACPCLTNQIGGPRFAALQPIQPYTRRADGLVVLSPEYITNELTPAANHFEISECNADCSCPSSCFNKVVQRGRTVPLEIFETAKCGFGVRSSDPIVRGQFIDLYLGEVITQLELERRENAKEENASSYIYSLDWFAQQNCYHVDGENFGTAMRFVNHCCAPNARSFTVQTHKGDKHVYYLAFFAIQDIPADTEICIDYSPQEEGKYAGSESGEGSEDEEQEQEQEEQEGIARCYCGAANCRKFLWRSAGRKRKKRKTLKHE